MTTKQKSVLAIGIIIIGLSIGIGIRHGIIEGIVCFFVLGYLSDVRLDQTK